MSWFIVYTQVYSLTLNDLFWLHKNLFFHCCAHDIQALDHSTIHHVCSASNKVWIKYSNHSTYIPSSHNVIVIMCVCVRA